MGYETRTTWQPEEGDYIGYDSIHDYLRETLGLKDYPPKYIVDFLKDAVFKLTDVHWGGRAAAAASANIGDFCFNADDPEDLRPYQGENAEEKYLRGVETLKALVEQAKQEELEDRITKEKKMLLTLLNKYGIPEGYNL